MIKPALRKRLEAFLRQHGSDDCQEEICAVQEARAWLAQQPDDKDLLLLAMAYIVQREWLKDADQEMERYRAAIAAFVARNGGVLKVNLDEIGELDGTMTSFVDPDGAAITYRFIQQNVLRS